MLQSYSAVQRCGVWCPQGGRISCSVLCESEVESVLLRLSCMLWRGLSSTVLNVDSTSENPAPLTAWLASWMSSPHVGVHHLQPAAQNSTGHQRLRKHHEHHPADDEGPKPPQRIETALVHPEDTSVFSPVYYQWPVWGICSPPLSTFPPLMEAGTGGFDLLMSTTSSLVFPTLSCRWFCSHHMTKLPTSSSSSVMHQPLQSCQETGENGRSEVEKAKRMKERGSLPAALQCCWSQCCQAGSQLSRTQGGSPPASLTSTLYAPKSWMSSDDHVLLEECFICMFSTHF